MLEGARHILGWKSANYTYKHPYVDLCFVGSTHNGSVTAEYNYTLGIAKKLVVFFQNNTFKSFCNFFVRLGQINSTTETVKYFKCFASDVISLFGISFYNQSNFFHITFLQRVFNLKQTVPKIQRCHLRP